MCASTPPHTLLGASTWHSASAQSRFLRITLPRKMHVAAALGCAKGGCVDVCLL